MKAAAVDQGPAANRRRPSARELRRRVVVEAAKLLVAAGLVAGSACILWTWITARAPETPENAVIDFGISWQLGVAEDAADRICAARRDEFLDPASTLHREAQASLGSKGLSDHGWPSTTLADGVVLVYHSVPSGAPPPGEFVTPPEEVIAFEMVREGDRWRVCGLRPTGEHVPGFDIRRECFPGEVPRTDDPGHCRPS